jgi:hypothetical protein
MEMKPKLYSNSKKQGTHLVPMKMYRVDDLIKQLKLKYTTTTVRGRSAWREQYDFVLETLEDIL